MNYVLDMHTHTIASGHAYSTILEMAAAAKEKGLKLLGITEHAPSMPGTCHEFYFQNLKCLDRNGYALPLLFGVELNILDTDGSVDMTQELLSTMDIAVASLHPPCIPFMDKADTTKTILNIMKNPHIHIIGHLDDERFPVDYEEIAKAAKETKTLLEVNNSSLAPGSFRANAKENYKVMLAACEKYQVPIILNSDAHVDTNVGNCCYSEPLILETGFPEELIVNSSVEKFRQALK